jgi:hypothetical protein
MEFTLEKKNKTNKTIELPPESFQLADYLRSVMDTDSVAYAPKASPPCRRRAKMQTATTTTERIRNYCDTREMVMHHARGERGGGEYRSYERGGDAGTRGRRREWREGTKLLHYPLSTACG